MLHRNIMHHTGELMHCTRTNMVLAKTRYTPRSHTGRGVGIGMLAKRHRGAMRARECGRTLI